MNNINVKAGQVWERTKSTEYEKWNTVEIVNTDGLRVAYRTGCVHVNSGIDDFLQDHKFIPQSDLEWLAVKVESLGSNIKFIARRGSEYLIFETKPEHTPGLYTSQEHQNMRYELGLDEKPERSGLEAFAMGCGIAPPVRINCPCATATLKDTKMIDLTPAKSGDKFVLNNGTIVTFFARTLMNSICTLDSGHAMVYHHNGKFDESVEPNDNKSNWDIVSKHDPRHWLSQLPDAGLFELFGAEYISCAQTGDWYADNSESDLPAMWLNKDKMPKLTGDEWKLSKISIVDLAAWQVANKRERGGPIRPGTAYIVGERGGPDVPVPAGPIVNNSRKEQSK